MNDGGAGGSSKVIKSWTVKQERKTTHTAPQNWGGWYHLHSVHVGRPWLISRERTKPCCIMLGDADGSVFLPDVSVSVTAALRSALASVWCPPSLPPPVTDSGTGCEPFDTRGQRAILFTQSFFPDRDGRLNKFSTYAHHMETLIYFFSTATLKCEPTPKPLYITFNFKKRCQSSRLSWLPGSSGRLIRSQRASESVTRRAAVYFMMRTCDPVTTQ